MTERLHESGEKPESVIGQPTPGPWNWRNNPYADGTPYITIQTSEFGYYPNGFHFTGIFSVADARLIAAAPDLLGVARAVAAYFYGTDSPLGERAREVVAKATGGAS